MALTQTIKPNVTRYDQPDASLWHQLSLVVEYVHKIKLWDKGKTLEQLSKYLGLGCGQGRSDQPRALSHLSDEELYRRLLDSKAKLDPVVEHEQGQAASLTRPGAPRARTS